MKRTRPRDVPHQRKADKAAKGEGWASTRAKKPSMAKRIRDRLPKVSTGVVDDATVHRDRRRIEKGSYYTRVAGPNGSWPTHGVAPGAPPGRPQISMIVEDLAAELAPAAIFGQYPVGLIEKLLPWFGCDRTRILHVCSGALGRGEGIRVDIRPDARPDIIADGRALPLADASIEAVLIDPPYTAQYAKDLYGVEYPRPAHLLAEAVRVVRPCGIIGLVHYLVPMPPPGARHVKTLGLSMGFGFPMRAVTLFVRDQAELALELA